MSLLAPMLTKGSPWCVRKTIVAPPPQPIKGSPLDDLDVLQDLGGRFPVVRADMLALYNPRGKQDSLVREAEAFASLRRQSGAFKTVRGDDAPPFKRPPAPHATVGLPLPAHAIPGSGAVAVSLECRGCRGCRRQRPRWRRLCSVRWLLNVDPQNGTAPVLRRQGQDHRSPRKRRLGAPAAAVSPQPTAPPSTRHAGLLEAAQAPPGASCSSSHGSCP